jgi:hypothetical protein
MRKCTGLFLKNYRMAVEWFSGERLGLATTGPQGPKFEF